MGTKTPSEYSIWLWPTAGYPPTGFAFRVVFGVMGMVKFVLYLEVIQNPEYHSILERPFGRNRGRLRYVVCDSSHQIRPA